MSDIVVARYYPTLDTVINTDEIPEILGFLKTALEGLLSSIHFKDLQYSKSVYGDKAFYSLKIVSKDRIEIEVPGTGIFLVLNPDVDDAQISSFPITIQYEWPILAYLRSFNLEGFSFTPEDFFHLALQVLKISEEQVIANAINIFADPQNPTTTALQQFIANVNAQYAIDIAEPLNTDNPIPEITAALQSALSSDITASIVVFTTYMGNLSDLDETKRKLNQFFKSLLPTDDLEQYIKDLIVPKFAATLTLSAAIEFPRSILKPVYDEFGKYPGTEPPLTGEALTELPDEGDGNPKVMLSFGQALFYADTEEGFGYNLDVVLNTNYPAQIGNTGLIVDIHNLKIDLSRNSNIIEADLDNRPPEFMGIYTDVTTIYLPKKWFEKETGQTLAITGERLLIGTGGMSGTIALRATYAIQESGEVTDYFSEYFQIDYSTVVKVVSNGSEEIIADQTALLAHINSLSSPYDLRFAFPLNIITNTGTKTFQKEAEYNAFISTIDPDQFMWFQLGKNPERAWRLGFNRFDLTFHHGSVIESNLKARLEIPKFKNPDNPTEKAIIDFEGHWYSEEDFSLTATFLPAGFPLNLFNFMTINFLSAEIGKDDDNFFIGTACEVSFQNAIMNRILGDQKIVLPHLRIYDNGSIEIVGGNSFIPTNISINLGPVEIAVSGIHFGSHQREHNGVMRKYNYWGFDGAISLDPLGFDARGEGVKFYYTVDNDEHGGDGHSYLHIKTIEVDLIIPGDSDPETATAIIHGMLSIPEPGESQEYIGEVSIQLPKAKIGGGAAMRLQPRHPAFIIEAGIDIPVPIPLGTTGIGFYGFGGLLGYDYVAEKEAIGLVSGENTWYEYFTHPQRGVNIHKFSGPEREHDVPFSIGAGTVLGTMFDDGYTFSTRLMAILSLPSVFILDGRANVLGERIAMLDNSEPPFFAGVAFGDDSIEFWFGADYQLPSNGFIIDLYAEVQAGFFFNNPSAWYVNFGTKQDPITARLLTIVTAQSFLMLSAQGIEAGARTEFDLRRNFFGIKVHIYAYIESGGNISFERPQLGGYVAMGGGISVNVWKAIFLSAGLDAILSAEAARPFLVYAELRFRFKLKIGFIKLRFKIKLKLKWGGDNEPDRTPVPPLPFAGNPNAPALNSGSSNHIDRTEQSVKGIHMLTGEAFELDFIRVTNDESTVNINPNEITKIIPVDTFIDFKVMKGLLPGAASNQIGGVNNPPINHVDLIPPQRVVLGGRELRQVKHKYSIENIEIKALDDNGDWVLYHPFQAVIKPEDGLGDVTHLPLGYWQKSSKQYNAVRLLATNPFSYLTAGEPGWFIPEQMGIGPSDLFCETERRTLDCMNFLSNTVGVTYYPPTQYEGHDINGVQFDLVGSYFAEVGPEGTELISDDNFRISAASNSHGYAKSLEFDNFNSLEILLPEPSVQVELLLNTHAQGVKIRYYKSLLNNTSPNAIYEQIAVQTKTAGELTTAVSYTNETEFISKVIISPNTPNSEEINNIELQIEQLWLEAYNNAIGEDAIILNPAQEAQLDALEAQLLVLKGETCSLPVSKYYFVNRYEEQIAKSDLKIPNLRKSGTHYYAGGSYHKNPDELLNRAILKFNEQGTLLQSYEICNRNSMTIAGDDVLPSPDGWLDYKFITHGDDIFNVQITNFRNDLNVISNKEVQYGIFVENLADFPSAYIKELDATHTFFCYANHKEECLSLTLFDNQGSAKDFGTANSIPVNKGTVIHKISPYVDSLGASILVETAEKFYVLDFQIESSRIGPSSVYLVDSKKVSDIENIRDGRMLIAADIKGKYGIAIARRSGTTLTISQAQFSNELEFRDVKFVARYFANDEVYVRNEQFIFRVRLPESGSFGITQSWKLLDGNNAIQHLRYDTNENHFVISSTIDRSTNPPTTYTGVVKSNFDTCILTSFSPVDHFNGTALALIAMERRFENKSYEVRDGAKVQTAINFIVNEICPLVLDQVTPQKCFTTLQEICWMTLENHEFNISIPSQAAIAEDQQDMEEAIEKIVQPVWRPNTKYYVKFTLKDEVDNGESAPGIYDYYYGFKTVGPVGHFQHHPEVNYIADDANPDQYPITSLRQYIDYNRSYPNADGSLLQAKPLFYGANQCKINLFFDKQWAYHMLNTWPAYQNMSELQGALNIAIKDPVTDVVIPYPLPENFEEDTVPVPENEAWESDTDPNIPAGILLLNNLLNSTGINCELQIGDPLSPAGYTYGVTLTNLKPQKLYTALFYNAFEVNSDDVVENKEIHQYVFQTSRYKDFNEQVQSYLLTDDAGNQRAAMFSIPITVTTAEVTTAYNIVAGINDTASDALETQYQHHFDRTLEGVLGLKPLDPPVSTEFNRIINETDDKTIGLLIRNPEPFNIPKIPLNIIQDTIEVINSAGEVLPDYKVLYSKDYSQAMIMHSNGQIEATTISIRFTYKTWDGNSRQYVSTDTATIHELQIQ